jgi:hypothetical protein
VHVCCSRASGRRERNPSNRQCGGWRLRRGDDETEREREKKSADDVLVKLLTNSVQHIHHLVSCRGKKIIQENLSKATPATSAPELIVALCGLSPPPAIPPPSPPAHTHRACGGGGSLNIYLRRAVLCPVQRRRCRRARLLRRHLHNSNHPHSPHPTCQHCRRPAPAHTGLPTPCCVPAGDCNHHRATRERRAPKNMSLGLHSGSSLLGGF